MFLSKGRIALLSYAVMSIAITLFNKAVLSSYHFPYSKTLTLAQSTVSLTMLVLLKRFKLVDYEDFNLELARRVFPLSVVFLFYVVISLSALGAVNLPMFTALRRTTILLVLLGEYLFLSKSPTRKTILATTVMTTGAIIAALKDLTYDPVSYTLVALTNLSTAGYTVSISRVKKETNLSVFGLLFYNNVLTLPFLFAIVLMSSELSAVAQFEYITDPTFMFLFASSSVMAFLLNLATFFSTSLNSPLTQTVCGQLKNFIAFLMGLVLFTDYVYDPINMLGLIIGFSGGLLYAYFQYTQKATAVKSNPEVIQDAKGPTAKVLADRDPTGPAGSHQHHRGVAAV